MKDFKNPQFKNVCVFISYKQNYLIRDIMNAINNYKDPIFFMNHDHRGHCLILQIFYEC